LPYKRPPQTLKPPYTENPPSPILIIPYTSNNPTHHKYAAVRFLFSSLNSYNLQYDEYQHELNIIYSILQNNGFPVIPHKPHAPKPTQPKNKETPKKWARFTYNGRETSYIRNIFRKTDLKIALHTRNTTGNLLTPQNPNPDIYTLSGAYKLTCPDCNKAYVGQTGRKFSARYKENKTAFRNNNHSYSFARHLNDTAHPFGPMKDVMQILQCHKKGPHLNTIERFHIHTESKVNNHLNDDHTIFPNAIFDALLKNHQP
jgi:hypothetical protein